MSSHDSDSALSPEDLDFITKVRAYAHELGLYFSFYINPIIHSGALCGYEPSMSYQKVFAGTRDPVMMERIRGFLEGYAQGRRHGRDQGRRGMQSELRSLLGIEEDNGQVYISR